MSKIIRDKQDMTQERDSETELAVIIGYKWLYPFIRSFKKGGYKGVFSIDQIFCFTVESLEVYSNKVLGKTYSS